MGNFSKSTGKTIVCISEYENEINWIRYFIEILYKVWLQMMWAVFTNKFM
jgi:hypothetical protein